MLEKSKRKGMGKFLLLLILIVIILAGCVGPGINPPKVAPEDKVGIGIGISTVYIPNYEYYDRASGKDKTTTMSYGAPSLSLGWGIIKDVEIGFQLSSLLDASFYGKYQMFASPILSFGIGVGLLWGYATTSIGIPHKGVTPYFTYKALLPYGIPIIAEGPVIKQRLVHTFCLGLQLQRPKSPAGFIIEGHYSPFPIWGALMEEEVRNIGYGVGISAGLQITVDFDRLLKILQLRDIFDVIRPGGGGCLIPKPLPPPRG